MADIDKSLPNVARPEDEITEDIEIEEVEETGQGPVEITDEEDGGATIDFDPSQVNIQEGGNHDVQQQCLTIASPLMIYKLDQKYQ